MTPPPFPGNLTAADFTGQVALADLISAEPGIEARRVDWSEPPPRLRYRMTDADAPSGAAVVYLLGAAGVVLLLAIGWLVGILTTVAVLT